MSTLRDLGEKVIIRSIIKPLFNPGELPGLVGDDCAVLDVTKLKLVCLSTDRVPANLISFKLGIIDYAGLGYYLAVLNISDIVANGARPVGLLLTFAFEGSFLVDDFKQILLGVKRACDEYGCTVLGGDLSDSREMSLAATSVGVSEAERMLYRSGAMTGDSLYCSDYAGLTATAFAYFLEARPRGMRLESADEEVLKDQFRKPTARVALSRRLAASGRRITCMDNTDGVAQSLLELAEINGMAAVLRRDALPVHRLSRDVAAFLGRDAVNLALGPGADFQLIGSLEAGVTQAGVEEEFGHGMRIIGDVRPGTGVWIADGQGRLQEHQVEGWNYYAGEVAAP